MTTDMIVVTAVLLFALICFITEWLRYDLVALLALFTLAGLGLVPGDEIFSGFSNPAIITVASLTVISDAFRRSGAVFPMAVWIGRVATSPAFLAALAAVTVALMSAFMNNVAAITLLLPVMVRVCRGRGWSPSKVLIPLAFGSLVGGITTLIGTPPNLLASDMLREWGYEPLGFFEMTPLAVPVLAVSALYFGVIAHRLLPESPVDARTAAGGGADFFLIEAVVPPDSAVSNQLIRDTNLGRNFEAMVLGIIRDDHHITNPGGDYILQPGDIVQIEVPRHNLVPMQQVTGLEPAGPRALQHLLEGKQAELTDVVVGARSPLIGRTLRQLRFRSRHQLQVLALAHHGRQVTERIADVPLEGGDTLLLLGKPELIDEVTDDLRLVLLDREPLSRGTRQILHVALLFAAMIGATIAGLMPISLAAMGAALLMIITGAIRVRHAYDAIPWSVLALLGAMAGVASAVEYSGLTRVAVRGMVGVIGDNPLLLMAILYVLSCVITSLVTPPATILIIGPLVHGLAAGVGVDPRPFLIMVTLGVSCAFLTPFGHQSNVLVFSAGNYRFADYFRVGLPLCLIILIVALLVIPMLWSF